ncbi:MAG: hypothetical protein JW712_02820 [Dehalococcoidales bacterium]|nr:hypothetical protein [Dehalococcoidales bacterium]
MDFSLLETKLYIPPLRPGLVTRPRLLARLQESLQYNFILVSAPAGFGKTTLVSEWVTHNRSNFQTAWVSLEKSENDPSLFWEYFITAIRKIRPGIGNIPLKLLHSDQLVPIQNILTTLLNDITSISSHLVLVLDDYYIIESRQIHDGITFFIEHLPPHVHLVIASRADPPLPLARFRGKAMMLELHTDDLRFSIEDAIRLFSELKISELSETDILALNERTEGWAAGLKMAAISVEDQTDIPDFIASFTGSQRYIMDYLLEEVLQAQSEEIRDFLMKTSVLERFSADLCDTLTGRHDSREILMNFERGHLFIVPLDEMRYWYRYELLFADLLRHQCETTFGAEQVTVLYRQASQWYEDNMLLDEAVNHALAARDWARAVRLISIVYEEHRKRGEFDTLLGWFNTVPQELLRENLLLYGHYAVLFTAFGRMDLAEAILDYLQSRTLNDIRLQGEVALAQGLVYRYQGDTARCIELLETAFTLLPPDDIAIRGVAAANIVHASQRIGHFQEAEKWAMVALDLTQQAGDIFLVYKILGQLGIISGYQGKLKRAVEYYEKSDELAVQIAQAGSQSMLCMHYYILNDLEAADEKARLAIEQNGLDIIALFYQAQICLVRGDTAGAESVMQSIDQVYRHPAIDSIWRAKYIAFHVMYAIRRGNLEEASLWGERLPDSAKMMPLDWPVRARLLVEQGKKKQAAGLLQELYDEFIQSGAFLMVRTVRIYQALAADDEKQALDFLAEALTKAKPEGVIRDFVDEGRLLKPLLEKALAGGITPEFTKKLLDIIEEEELQRQVRRSASSTPLSSSLLSQRELEVIKLLADDVSNQRIAEQLCVSLGTVKTHVHHIIEKLEVKDRRQAVLRVKELKLI